MIFRVPLAILKEGISFVYLQYEGGKSNFVTQQKAGNYLSAFCHFKTLPYFQNLLLKK